MSDRFDAVMPAACNPPTEARAARLAKFRREQLIVDYLNRGVSVAEIAARVGVGEKRMRAVIREIFARRMPHPPEEFVAIQVSRLNEALLVAFSVMSPTNLKAVDQVVKIVRELDRYGGAFAAEWAPAQGARGSKRRPTRTPRSSRRGSAAPSLRCRTWIVIARSASDVAIQGNLERPCSPGSPPPGLFDPRVARDDGVALDNLFGAYARPQNPPQALERVDFGARNWVARAGWI